MDGVHGGLCNFKNGCLPESRWVDISLTSIEKIN